MPKRRVRDLTSVLPEEALQFIRRFYANSPRNGSLLYLGNEVEEFVGAARRLFARHMAIERDVERLAQQMGEERREEMEPLLRRLMEISHTLVVRTAYERFLLRVSDADRRGFHLRCWRFGLRHAETFEGVLGVLAPSHVCQCCTRRETS